MLLINILGFVLILGVLIFVHEFGHFIVAKWSKMKVSEFAFGFPPTLFSWRKKDTKYLINSIPIGGYVKIEGEDGDSKNPNSFNRRPIRYQVLTLFAGVFMNWLLAVVALTIGFMIGMIPPISNYSDYQGQKEIGVIVTKTIENSPAQIAHIKAGQKIISINGEQIKESEDVSQLTQSYKGQKIALELSDINGNNGEIKSVLLGENDVPLGVYLSEVYKVKLGFLKAIFASVKETFVVIWAIIDFLGQFLKQLFVTGTLSNDVAGPIGIYFLTSQAIGMGIVAVLQLVAIFSINLAVINILPFPALDGGRVLFILLKKQFGKKIVHEKIEAIIHMIGFILLILLMVAITYQDIIQRARYSL
ncbi:hypothetical protein COZ61_02000 [Candidatus Berkelbacteria bacterium CG_4_8_14_3_um_filter_33_6]|uniref:PDZ domain-containing protein n=1 Tax=Candidatus Berkelbacteria bacterium CG_4_10_14_0_2_um_filter_35_9_33_12 TaxID=1974499 RepID=A0A2M7W4E9_9BACT|nr:MAG: hypothetical protein COX10_00985 [Candidatus Berkelbacteria bacterium CG23_combo_of_CG06-09_8_20_14_all_33_15]PIS08417.1 MAG: hypothetical protein COT76_01550 [Candidatus Berkelbacteria bacterium CG10_big_fil_rev_8_21_14_0_10_33_10]PIX31022.1 MAG: hypothetical protein COZ61_02000 [Candidatus Berkelbacteria bacterium CG_4_8_14_3_um_filter_33_6]PIZ28039.1 MAG: hypothetical protein COY43_02645 [Candidatus Berkelbacteria bacterium CG_4_10_14_0_8_um_filter_35_9_33_8]PJA20647.1 MAG: hypotheti